MHTIKLAIQDSVFDKVIYFLNNLPKSEVKIIEDLSTSDYSKPTKFRALKLETKGFHFSREEANER